MKIYTRTGDNGTTGLWGGQRVTKDAPRVAAYGEVDELNAMLGVVRASGVDPMLDEALGRVQQELFVVGADLATPGEATRIDRTSAESAARLEQEIDQFEAELEPLRQFILPGGALPSAYLHLARTICRRAERCVVALAAAEPVNQAVLTYFNRLSDWLFVLARLVNVRAGVADVPWNSPVR
ncbi:MAG: cob(I)yrinic acid a,c-diamide adenosyltransferase [Chloroflexaceae bacterium]|nr:cob(I)yrinic acid a,c-diamide adenosyltransferase [Chloroflexaceae bacterium]